MAEAPLLAMRIIERFPLMQGILLSAVKKSVKWAAAAAQRGRMCITKSTRMDALLILRYTYTERGPQNRDDQIIWLTQVSCER